VQILLCHCIILVADSSQLNYDCIRIYIDYSHLKILYLTDNKAIQLCFNRIHDNHVIANFPQNVLVREFKYRLIFGEDIGRNWSLTLRPTLYSVYRSHS